MTDEDHARWIRLVADFESSDLTQREFAIERCISYTNLRKLDPPVARQVSAARARNAKQLDDQGPERDASEGGSRLLLVRMVGSARKARRGEPAKVGDGLLELALPSGARVRFPAGTNVGYLRALAAAL